MDSRPSREQLAAALHESAHRNHNLGEGMARAICQSVESHLSRADAILAALPSEPPSRDPMCAVHTFVRLADCEVHGPQSESPSDPERLDEERLATIVSDSLAAATMGTDWAEAPTPSDEPGSPYVMRLTNEILARLNDTAPEEPHGQ